MLNVVIISKDLNEIKDLFNFLYINNNKLKVVGIYAKIEELLEIVQEGSIDIILINMENLDYGILKTNKLLSTYLKSMIIISKQYKEIKKEVFVYSYIEDINNFEEIGKAVNKLSNSKIIDQYFEKDTDDKNSVMELIEKELKYLKLQKSYKGVTYLMEVIYMLCNFEDDSECNLERDIYPIIAQKHHKLMINIKCNVNYVITVLYAECEEDKLMEYLDEYNLTRLSPKKVILSIANNVRKKMESIDTMEILQ